MHSYRLSVGGNTDGERTQTRLRGGSSRLPLHRSIRKRSGSDRTGKETREDVHGREYTDEATYRIEVRETDYLFETDQTGFLYGSELSELAGELRPVLPETDAFYAEIARDIGSHPDACQLRIVDAIAILCEQAGDDELLIHEFSY